ncbi:MAG: DUF502 domain-containing protein [Candidatus Omnitrophica bacterium]|nr:DUF502 domain-containing protein [Candidatus Omnitrophota bacterium]
MTTNAGVEKGRSASDRQKGWLIRVRKYFFAGIAALFPLAVTIYILVFLFQAINGFAERYINSVLFELTGSRIPGLGFIVLILCVVGVGVLSTHLVGQKLFPWLERLLLKIPFVANIYPAAKQLSDFLFGEKKTEFQKVVLVEYPYPGTYSLGFLTNEQLDVLSQKTGKDLVNVFIALAPAPFSGLLMLFPREKVQVLDVAVDTALKYIISGGVVFEEAIRQKRRQGRKGIDV